MNEAPQLNIDSPDQIESCLSVGSQRGKMLNDSSSNSIRGGRNPKHCFSLLTELK
jgi:hypothetical protein